LHSNKFVVVFVIVVFHVQGQTHCHNVKLYNIKVDILKYGGLHGQGFAA
jgi:hypothetical protein